MKTIMILSAFILSIGVASAQADNTAPAAPAQKTGAVKADRAKIRATHQQLKKQNKKIVADRKKLKTDVKNNASASTVDQDQGQLKQDVKEKHELKKELKEEKKDLHEDAHGQDKQ